MRWKSLKYFILILFITQPILQACGKDETKSHIQAVEGFAKINGTEIYFNRMGQGEPIIVVHGGPVLDHGDLMPFFGPLENNYELIYYDQRLSGRSSADVDSADITIDHFIDDIEELRTRLGLEDVHLMAHSWGGLLAMKYALKYPENLKSMILLNSMPANTELWQEESRIIAQTVTREDSLKRQ